MACLETNWGRKGAPGLDSNVQLTHFEIRGKCIGHKFDLFLRRHIWWYSSKLKTCRQMAEHGRLIEFRGIFEKPDYSTDSNSQKYDNYTTSENKSYFIDGRKMSEYTIQICSIVKAGLSALKSIIYDNAAFSLSLTAKAIPTRPSSCKSRIRWNNARIASFSFHRHWHRDPLTL